MDALQVTLRALALGWGEEHGESGRGRPALPLRLGQGLVVELELLLVEG
jgi:hypothetical protein